MSATFSLPTVLRMIPHALLRRFFVQLELASFGVDWETVRQRDPRPIIRAINALQPAKIDEIEAVLRRVFELANDNGIAAIREACEAYEVNYESSDEATVYEQAMRFWLQYPDIADQAARIYRIENLTWWRKRPGLPQQILSVSADRLRAFEQELSALFLAQEGRGRNCTVEHLLRKGTDYILAYPDDYTQSITRHDAQSRLVSVTQRPTFTLFYAYNREHGTLETYTKAPSRTKPKVEALFARFFLDFTLPEWPKKPTYQLAPLKDAYSTMNFLPSDPVTLHIRQIRLRCPNSQREIQFRGDARFPNDTENFLNEVMNQESCSLGELEVIQTQLDFEFSDGQEPRVVTLSIATPTSCNLRNIDPKRADLIQKYLVRWGIEHHADPSVVPAVGVVAT